MTRARILADYVAGGTTAAEFDHMDGVTSNVQTQLDTKATSASPDFTGTVDLTGTTVSLDDDEISLDKVNGGTLGTGTIGGSSIVNTSGTITTTGAISGGSLVTTDLILNNTKSMANEVDGTSGHWCVQEGDSDLFIINRVTNKKYKFKLEEIA